MKKILLFTVAIMMAVCTNAQVWWGYMSESDLSSSITIGTGSANMTFMAGIYVPANHEEIGGATVKAVRVYVADNLGKTMKNVSVWISKTQPATLKASDYVQKVASLSDGANDIELDTPYQINNEAFYIGYAVTSSNAYPIMSCGTKDAPNAFLISSPGLMEWSDLNGNGFGKLAFQILVEGGSFKEYSATIDDFKPAVGAVGQTLDIPVEVTNMGSQTITDLAYTVTVDGVTSAEKTISGLSIPYRLTQQVAFAVEASAIGSYSYTLTITKVNSNANAATNNTATGKVTIVETLKTWPRNVLIEEFTTEKCVYCPQAASGLASFLSTYPDLASRVAVACHHDGFYTDWLTIPASTSYCWFYNAGGGTYAPAFMYDRFAWDDQTPVVNRESGAAGYKDRVENRIAVDSYANIELNANFNDDMSKISVTANCERCWDFSGTPSRITLFVTEDNIKAKSQSGASGTFIHQHVLRAVNATWGSVLSWNDDKANYEYTFDVDSSWKPEDLKVIAFISGYDSKDPTNCVVENVATVVPGTFVSAISTLNADETAVSSRYTLDGRQVSAPQRGLNIMKMANGRTVKVLVK